MAKLEFKAFPNEIAKCTHNPKVRIIKTRSRGRDRYSLEVCDRDTPVFTQDPKMSYKAGEHPDFDDTWCQGTWASGANEGCVYDLNLFDRYNCGDGKTGIGGTFYSCYEEGRYISTDTGDMVTADVECWFCGHEGKRTKFICDDPEKYIALFGEWAPEE